MKDRATKKGPALSRRNFLKGAATTGAAVTLPWIVPARVLGHDAPSNRIVFGCIGTGGQGKHNMRAFMNRSDTQLVAVCDVDAGHAEEAAKNIEDHYARQYDYAGPKNIDIYADFRELLARDDIDAVTVCTPDHWHGLISVAAAKAGKDIYCEKPLTNSIAEGIAIREAVERHGRVLQTGSHERSRFSVRYACELVRNGRIGKLQTIQVNMPNSDAHHLDIINRNQPQPIMPVPAPLDWDFWLGHTPAVPYTEMRCHFWWRFVLDYGGGEMTDRGAHIIDIGQLGNGTDHTGPVTYEARGSRPKNGLYDTFLAYKFRCQYANGVWLLGSSDSPRGLKFIGEDGRWIFIHIHGGRLQAEPKSLLKEFIGPNELHLGRSEGHHADFINSVKTRRRSYAHHEIGHRTATICHLTNIAMILERKLKWDPVAEQITNDPEANRMLTRTMRSPWQL